MLKKSFPLESRLYRSRLVQQAIIDFGAGFYFTYEDGILMVTAQNDAAIRENFGELMNYVVALHSESGA